MTAARRGHHPRALTAGRATGTTAAAGRSDLGPSRGRSDGSRRAERRGRETRGTAVTAGPHPPRRPPQPGRRRSRRAVRALALLALAAACVAPGAGAAGVQPGSVVLEALTCVAPGDAAGLDRILARAGSPLAGQGAAFVDTGREQGLDPRFLVAIAAHETLLGTYAPARASRNPFGIGPGRAFASEEEAIRAAGRILGRYYLPEGRVTVAAVGAKWAPPGAANDPGGLNRHWPRGVATYFAALGGDPGRPVTLTAQAAHPSCRPTLAATPVTTAWDGRPPRSAGEAIYQGADPATGLPATIPGFVFPLAPPVGGAVRYADDFAQRGRPGAPGCFGRSWRCAITLEQAPGTPVVAAARGVLRPATPAEQAGGIGFWLDTGRERLGYGPLARYAEGIWGGAAVEAGQPLGSAPAALLFTWERDGVRVNPHPLLSATRPSD